MSESSLSEFLKSVFEVLGVDELNLKQVKKNGNKVYEFEKGKEADKYDANEYSYYSSYGSYTDDSSTKTSDDTLWSKKDQNKQQQYNSKPSSPPYAPNYEKQPSPAPYTQNYISQPAFAKDYQPQPVSHSPQYNNQPASYNSQQPNAQIYNTQRPPAPSYNSQPPAKPYVANQNLPPNFVNRDNYENFRFCGKQLC